jgi:hypothetical protein
MTSFDIAGILDVRIPVAPVSKSLKPSDILWSNEFEMLERLPNLPDILSAKELVSPDTEPI